MTPTIAALFVAKNGPYFGLAEVDPWDKDRDARRYAGPLPVIAHPPCERWGRYWFGNPTLSAKGIRFKKGDDNGCFAAALAAVRRWGGVLEHPEGSHAWKHFGLTPPPRSGGWIWADMTGQLWTCCIEQGYYGHKARKATWLLFSGPEAPPALKWGRAPGEFKKMEDSCHSAEERRQRRAAGTLVKGRLTNYERLATPEPMRDVLLGLVRPLVKVGT